MAAPLKIWHCYGRLSWNIPLILFTAGVNLLSSRVPVVNGTFFKRRLAVKQRFPEYPDRSNLFYSKQGMILINCRICTLQKEQLWSCVVSFLVAERVRSGVTVMTLSFNDLSNEHQYEQILGWAEQRWRGAMCSPRRFYANMTFRRKGGSMVWPLCTRHAWLSFYIGRNVARGRGDHTSGVACTQNWAAVTFCLSEKSQKGT